jgi:uncharacterized membrane protein HdeD (DUF308 family)
MPPRLLKWLAFAMGVSCLAIGLYHLVLGIASVPGEQGAGATVDSRERFYNAVFAGYGVAWIWAARQAPIPATLVRWLAGAMLLGGVGRVVSVLQHGWPHWWQVPLSVVELVVPPLFLWPARTVGADSARAGPAA